MRSVWWGVLFALLILVNIFLGILVGINYFRGQPELTGPVQTVMAIVAALAMFVPLIIEIKPSTTLRDLWTALQTDRRWQWGIGLSTVILIVLTVLSARNVRSPSTSTPVVVIDASPTSTIKTPTQQPTTVATLLPTAISTVEPPTARPTEEPPTATPTRKPPTATPEPIPTKVPPTPIPPTSIPPTPIPPTPAPSPKAEGSDLGDNGFSIVLNNSYFTKESDSSNYTVIFNIVIQNNTNETMRIELNPRNIIGLDDRGNTYRSYLNELSEWKTGGCEGNVYVPVADPTIFYTLEGGKSLTFSQKETSMTRDNSYRKSGEKCTIKFRLPLDATYINVTIPLVRFAVGASSPTKLENLTWQLIFK